MSLNNAFEIDEALLLRLCRLLGIEGEFVDYKGERHSCTPAIRFRLIQALGIDISGNADAESLIFKLENESRQTILPPVILLRGNSPRSIEINIPESLAGSAANWKLQYEDGSIQENEFVPEHLQCIGESGDGDLRTRCYRLEFSVDLPEGYHDLLVTCRQPDTGAVTQAQCRLIVAPDACFQPDVLHKGERLWGLSVQLYTLRSDRNWGIGDFTDLKELVAAAAGFGAAFVGLNPLHALYPANPAHISPYSPSSRLFLNYIYLDIAAIPDYRENTIVRQFVESAEFQSQLSALRNTDFVDYPGVAALKLDVLKRLYNGFVATHLKKSTPRGRAFEMFIKTQGEALYEQAVYDALYARFFASDQQVTSWPRWPLEYHKPGEGAVRRFVDEHPDEIRFYQYLLWLADLQLADAQQAAIDAGMAPGLYRDLAVGVDGGGAEAWAEQDSYSFNASIGAPPDPLALQGQDWGLPPLNPRSLRENRYSTFIKVIRANMRHCGALRIDHVMSLLRLWWAPAGESATQGAYIYYPLHDLLGILALESRRNRCLVIGEDLGTVPEEIRAALPAANVYSYKVMYFEKDWHNCFKAPHDYARQAMATVTTHDLPPLAGWWEGDDLKLREELALFPTEAIREREYAARIHDRIVLLESLQQHGHLPDGMTTRPENHPEITPALNAAVHIQLAGSNAALMAVQPEDLLLMHQPVNVPGTVTEYPNWRRKLSHTVEEMFAREETQALLLRIDANRRRV